MASHGYPPVPLIPERTMDANAGTTISDQSIGGIVGSRRWVCGTISFRQRNGMSPGWMEAPSYSHPASVTGLGSETRASLASLRMATRSTFVDSPNSGSSLGVTLPYASLCVSRNLQNVASTLGPAFLSMCA